LTNRQVAYRAHMYRRSWKLAVAVAIPPSTPSHDLRGNF
jgi:hypothetical protein